VNSSFIGVRPYILLDLGAQECASMLRLLRRSLGTGPYQGSAGGDEHAPEGLGRMRRAPLAAMALLILVVAGLGFASSVGSTQLTTKEAFSGRVFDLPVDLVALPDGRYLLAQQSGEVLLVSEDGSGKVILDLGDRLATGHEELGMLAVAPEPAFDRTQAYFVHYTADDPLRNVVSRFTLDSDEESVVLEVPQPFENHNGGAMRFGPDGMLYVSFGDGGDAWDPLGHGQNPGTLLSTIVRIDVTSEPGAYVVPADNPFADPAASGIDARPEVWAYGVRNIWRFEFDEVTGDLWGGDVGQNDAEEVNLLEAGGNYGWSAFEGPSCRIDSCEGIDATPPVAWYSHRDGCAVVGGFVYHGDDLPLDGEYLYGDLCFGTIWSLPEDGEPREVLTVTAPIVGFARGHHGEVFVIRQGEPIVELVAE